MYTALVPCPACARHVRAHEPQCPFCETRRQTSDAPSLAEGPTRLSRAALLLGASLGLVGCPAPAPPTPAPPARTPDAGSPPPPLRTNPNAVPQPPQDPGSMAEVYGAPPPRDPEPAPAPPPAVIPPPPSMGTRYGAPPPPADEL